MATTPFALSLSALLASADKPVEVFFTSSYPLVWFGVGLLLALGIHVLARRLSAPRRVLRNVLAPLVIVERTVDDALQELERVQDARLREVRLAVGGSDVSVSSGALYLSRFSPEVDALYGLSFERALALGPRFAFGHRGLVEVMRGWDLHAEASVSVDEALTRLARLVDALAFVTAEIDESELSRARDDVKRGVLHAIVAALPDAHTVLH
jgi:hypothetical protein